jgi:hypothetical protein
VDDALIRQALDDIDAIIDDAKERQDWEFVERMERARLGVLIALGMAEPVEAKPLTSQERKAFRERMLAFRCRED